MSFIAPHSLTARALVVAPTDELTVHNRSREESVDVTVDGRPVCTLPPGEEIEARFVDAQGRLAQVAGGELLPPTAGEVRPAVVDAMRARQDAGLRILPAPERLE